MRPLNIHYRDELLLGESATLAEATEKMIVGGCGTVVLIDSARLPVALLSERDLLQIYARQIPGSARAYDHAATPVVVVRETAPRLAALNYMVEHHFRRIVVVDATGGYLGLVVYWELQRELLVELFARNDDYNVALQADRGHLWRYEIFDETIEIDPPVISGEPLQHRAEEWIQQLHLDSARQIQQQIVDHLAEQCRAVDLHLYYRDLPESTFQLQAVMSCDQYGEPVRLVGLLRDISDEESRSSRANFEEQLLIQRSRLDAMGEMVGALAHQWRQPLAGMSAIFAMIDDSIESLQIEGTAMDSELISGEIARGEQLLSNMSKTIDEFRSFFRISSQVEPLSLLESVYYVVRLLGELLRDDQIELRVESEFDEQVTIPGYPGEFREVLLNLINNSRQAIREARQTGRPSVSQIIISLGIDQCWYSIKIEDDGCGVTPEMAERLFDPYFTTREEGSGSGMGLYLARMVIEKNMGGEIFYKSKLVGAQFEIRFRQ